MQTFDEVLAALDGPLAVRGPWTAGQTLVHCAQSIEYSLAGFPRPAGWPVRRVLGPLAAWGFLRRGRLSHDVAAPIPGAPPLPDVTQEVGAARLREAIAAFRGHRGPLQPHFAYGPQPRPAYEALHALHLTDHLQGR